MCIIQAFNIIVSKTRVGNFIIGASGSDKQILCGSSVARAAPTIIGCKQDPKRGKLVIRRRNPFLWCGKMRM